MSRVVITLEENDLLALQEVLIDEDPDSALSFVMEHLVPKIPAKGTAPCDSSRHNPFLRGPGTGRKEL